MLTGIILMQKRHAHITSVLEIMVLLQATKNNAIGNKGFDEKKPILKVSAYILTSQVAEEATWGATAIATRQKKLAELAVKTWSLSVK